MAAATPSSSLPVSRSDTLTNDPPVFLTVSNAKLQNIVTYSTSRKVLLLIIFCISQFVDVFNNSALFAAIPEISKDLDVTQAQSTWIISATQLTFAAFLLISGRIADVYNPKYAFITGLACLGIVSVGTGFVNNKIGLFVLRAISGLFGSMTIPAALNMIVALFPGEKEQARAISVFGATSGISNIIGLIIGAIFVQYTSWRWNFWFAAMLCIPTAVLSFFTIPTRIQPEVQPSTESRNPASKLAQLDLFGVSILTIALVLLVFAFTSTSAAGWGSAQVLVPLVASIIMIVAFFFYERYIPEERAAVPPKTWFYPNFSVLFGSGLLPYLYWVTIFFVYTELWQEVYGWSAISTAIHMLPIGVSCFAMTFTGPLSRVIGPKWLILTGHLFMIIAGLIFPFANSEDRYWSYVFPAFTIGSAGAMLAYQHGNIAIFRSTPPRIAGTVGAMFNSALQLGSSVGAAVVTSIETNIENKSPNGKSEFKGRAAAFWFLLAVVFVEAIAVLVFYRPQRAEAAEDVETSQVMEEKHLKNNEAERDWSEEADSKRPQVVVGPAVETPFIVTSQVVS